LPYSPWTVGGPVASAFEPNTCAYVLDQIDVTLSAVNVHLPIFPPPFRSRMKGHLESGLQFRTTNWSFTVRFCCGFLRIFPFAGLNALPRALSLTPTLTEFFGRCATPSLATGTAPLLHGWTECKANAR